MRPNRLKQLWHDGGHVINAWLSIPSSWTAELMAYAGFDSLTVDMQHGLSDDATTFAMIQTISLTNAIPLVRVPWNDPAVIMRVLDAGAYGIICPMINSAAEAEAFVGACRYPPHGYRSYGPSRANLFSGDDYVEAANRTVLTLAMIETKQAMENLDAIAATPGLDGLYIGPADLSLGLGLPRLADFSNPDLLTALDRILAAAHANGIIAGCHSASPDESKLLLQRGFRMVTPATDVVLMRRGAVAAVAAMQG